MSKTKFEYDKRAAIWRAHSCKCSYCNRVIAWADLHIDHIIPEGMRISDYKALKERLHIPDNFNINGFENLLPAHNSCNLQKSGTPFDDNVTMFYLQMTQRKIKKCELEYRKYQNSRIKNKTLCNLDCLIQNGEISEKELETRFIELKKRNWAKLPIKVNVPIDFANDVVDVFYKTQNFAILYDKKLLICGGDEEYLELSDGVKVSTINEYREAIDNGYFAETTFAIKMSCIFEFSGNLLDCLQKASMPSKSFISDPWLSLSKSELLSADLLKNIDMEDALSKYYGNNYSIKDLVDKGEVKISHNSFYDISVDYRGFEICIKEQFRADFDNDGIEELFYIGYCYAVGGTMDYGITGILGRKSWDELIHEIDCQK